MNYERKKIDIGPWWCHSFNLHLICHFYFQLSRIVTFFQFQCLLFFQYYVLLFHFAFEFDYFFTFYFVDKLKKVYIAENLIFVPPFATMYLLKSAAIGQKKVQKIPNTNDETWRAYQCSAMHPFRLTKPMIRICGIVRRNMCIALQYSSTFYVFSLSSLMGSKVRVSVQDLYGHDSEKFGSRTPGYIYVHYASGLTISTM